MSILFLGKRNDHYAADAAIIIDQLFEDVTIFHTKRGDVLPDDVKNWSGDWIISYLCQWVVPAFLLERAKVGAINFHPGPPEYPGVGCTNFALYNEETEFGVTCHHMAQQVDTGSLIKVKRFPVFPDDSVLSLTKRSYANMIQLFNEVVGEMHAGNELPSMRESWTRKPYTRQELDALCELNLDMDEAEMTRRIRATTFPGMPGPYFKIMEKRFILEGTKPIPK